jgi:NAD(P)-dependent dehydrogenase (short-subunit alcohol dehydrogenase family)
MGVYCSTKFAVEGLTEALALELGPLGIRATVIEPGFFRTDFLDARSLSVSSVEIPDYAETAGAIRHFAAGANHTQPGDPDKLAKGVLRIVDVEEPPMRMPFGSDALQRIEAKNAIVARELAEWRQLVVSTDLNPVGRRTRNDPRGKCRAAPGGRAACSCR